MDWIDQERENRRSGINTPLLPSQHDAVNQRYPGLTNEICVDCGNETGNAGKGDGSLYTQNDSGPYCWDCYPEKVNPND